MRGAAQSRLFGISFSKIRRWVKCGVTVGAFVVTNAILVTKVRKAGGVWRVARRVLKARGKGRKLRILSGVFGEVLGLETIAEACGA